MRSYIELSKFARDMDKAAKDAPKRFLTFRRDVAKRYFKLLDQNAPPDDEGRLRSSFQKRPFQGEKEWVETYRKEEIDVGTSVYYASMVNDGHVVGKRDSRETRGHRKMDPDSRKALAAAGGKAWVSGVHFRERAEDAMEVELPQMVEKFSDEVLREVSG